MSRYDCVKCGACCCNTAELRARATQDYVEVGKDDELRRGRKDLLRQLAVRNDEGLFHMRLVGEDQRCAALAGEIGGDVRCTIYRVRPAGCRRVDAGDADCLAARRSRGLPVDA